MINFETVKEAVNDLKTGKTDPFSSISSDLLKNSSDKMIGFLVLLYRGFLIHGYTPK